MRAPLFAAVACLLFALPCIAADEAAPEKAVAKPLALSLPADADDCLKTLEAVLEHALDADLLDDQIDETETHLEKLETACHDGRFPEALEEAKAIEKIVAMNK